MIISFLSLNALYSCHTLYIVECVTKYSPTWPRQGKEERPRGVMTSWLGTHFDSSHSDWLRSRRYLHILHLCVISQLWSPSETGVRYPVGVSRHRRRRLPAELDLLPPVQDGYASKSAIDDTMTFSIVIRVYILLLIVLPSAYREWVWVSASL